MMLTDSQINCDDILMIYYSRNPNAEIFFEREKYKKHRKVMSLLLTFSDSIDEVNLDIKLIGKFAKVSAEEAEEIIDDLIYFGFLNPLDNNGINETSEEYQIIYYDD